MAQIKTTHDTTGEAPTRSVGVQRFVIWLDRHGIDCSRTANEDDAFVFAVLVATMFAMGLFAVSPWWSGFATATIIFNGKNWLHSRKQRMKAR